MPRAQLAGGTEVEVVGVLGEHVCECAFWFTQRPEVGPPLTEEAVATAVGNWWRDQVVVHLSAHYQFLRATATRFAGRTPPTFTVDYIDVFGGVGGNCCPANVAYRLNLEVARPPAGLRGCKFIPALPTFVVVGGRVAESWREDMLDAFANLIDMGFGLHLRWVVPRRFLNGVPLLPVQTMPVVGVDITNPLTGQRKSRLNPGHILPP